MRASIVAVVLGVILLCIGAIFSSNSEKQTQSSSISSVQPVPQTSSQIQLTVTPNAAVQIGELETEDLDSDKINYDNILSILTNRARNNYRVVGIFNHTDRAVIIFEKVKDSYVFTIVKDENTQRTLAGKLNNTSYEQNTIIKMAETNWEYKGNFSTYEHVHQFHGDDYYSLKNTFMIFQKQVN